MGLVCKKTYFYLLAHSGIWGHRILDDGQD